MDSIIKTIHRNLVSGKVSCVELVQEKLSLLGANTYHSANLLLKELALAQAKKVDEKIKSGNPIELLEGVPFGISDMILLQNCITTGSSDFLKQYVAPYTATAIQKLMDAGAIPIVKENGDSFGHGNNNENTPVVPVKNEYMAGSAVNVAQGLTAFSIGGDSGGSVGLSAGYHKIFGMKPTYGRISRCGLIANASSSDCISPLASTLEDIRILINTMSGKDSKDQTTYASSPIPETVFDFKKEIVAGYFLDKEIENDFQKMLDVLSAHGIKIVPLDFFDVNLIAAVYDVLAMAETASNFARLDGCLYGARTKRSSDNDIYMKTRAEHFSDETKRRIIGGSLVTSRGYEDVYLKAKLLRKSMIERFNACFNEVDVIVSPVCRDGWPSVSTSGRQSVFTAGFSLCGLPALTVPFFTPAGIQIAANKNQEDMILHFAHILKEIQ